MAQYQRLGHTRYMHTTFAELGLNEHILAGVEALGFHTPTPVQAAAIPAVLEGRDVVASAQTGTGKTAAFALPVLQRIAPASRAAREEIVRSATSANPSAPSDADKSPSSDVLLDAIPSGESLSVPAPAGGEAPNETNTSDGEAKPKRRRRRHHKKPATNTQTDTSEPQKSTEGPTIDKPSESEANKPKRRRRRRKKKSSAQETPASQEMPVAPSAESPSAETPSAESSAPKEKASSPKPSNPKRRRSASKKGSSGKGKSSTAKPPSFGPFALVVTPTRELAQQIDSVVSVVCEHTGQRAVIVMGGAKFDRQIKQLESGCDMLVATPGRLIDLMEHNHVDLSRVQVLVLDEADRMLDMGFWPSVRRILVAVPEHRQNLLFSATIPPSIKPTIDAMLHDPVHVEIARVGETADTVEEHLCPVVQGQKTQLLRELIRTGGGSSQEAIERVLVFCRTKQRVDDVSHVLKSTGFKVDVMHADRPQKARERALAKFREGACQVLVATDVMSRGIDVSGIDAVVNFDVPLDPEDYVHRIGRTGRAGATGQAYTFVAPDEISPLREIEYFTGKLIETWDLPDFAYDESRIVPSPGRSTVKPKRTMFSGMKSRGRGMSAGRYGRHY